MASQELVQLDFLSSILHDREAVRSGLLSLLVHSGLVIRRLFACTLLRRPTLWVRRGLQPTGMRPKMALKLITNSGIPDFKLGVLSSYPPLR